ncbi:MBL fold metallo-hydrolase [uncultured Gordonia sp.]|uniref:MBL fold metallo-hydrolase n=1 Tax=uncultured Gordonia sp. TaxID=198437 RepID=UPI002626DBB7|nr:MBL fold metallo-hydrolase [uncultured Gordonia sp.]
MTSTIEITGHSQHEAWLAKTMPPIEEVRPGLWSIPVPMPVSPLRYTLVYALVLPDGLALIDTGLDTDESWRALVDGIHVTGHDISEIRYVAITHLHPDHFGLVPRLLEHTDFTLAMHSNDAKFMRFRSDSEIQREQDWATEQLARLGAPTDIPETGMQHFTRLPKGRTVDVELDDHAPLNLPGWNVKALWTPGHTPGHLCFLDEDAGTVFTGDHLLPRISPNVSTTIFQPTDPLAAYLVSLAHTEQLPDVEALPSHEYRFRGLADRVTTLLSHHEERFDETAAAVAAHPQITAWEIARSVSWSRPFDDLLLPLQRMATRETHAHLTVLESRGILTHDGELPQRWSVAAT